VLWLQATGADAVMVTDETSSEICHDYVFPRKFEGLRVLHDTGQGESIYVIDVPPGEHSIRLVFETPRENVIGGALTVLALLTVAWLLGRSRGSPATMLPSQFA